jgi:hypothetical protein
MMATTSKISVLKYKIKISLSTLVYLSRTPYIFLYVCYILAG